MLPELQKLLYGLIGRRSDHAADRARASCEEGNGFVGRGDLSSAEARYRRAIAADPDFADARVSLGFVLVRQGHLDEARHHLDRVLSLAPGNADAHYLLGVIASEQGPSDESVEHFREAARIRPSFAEAHNALGIQYRLQRRIGDALSCFDRALAARPDFSEAQCEKGRALLLLGDYDRGLPLLERRFDAASEEQVRGWLETLAARPEKARWNGEDLRGKTLLLWMEQGAGDCLMTMRYLPKLRDRGAGRLTVLSDPSLARLVRTFPVVDAVVTRVEALAWDSFDVHCPSMSLPFAFRTRLDTIPNAVPYLFLPHEVRGNWSGRLSRLSGLRVGFAWAGSPGYVRDSIRSMTLRDFTPLLRVAGTNFVSLQKGAATGQLAASDGSIADWMDDCRDYLDTAALIAGLDLVISVDTSVAHLAGALGKPVWLLNRFASEWRWLLGRDDSPWYPSMRIFNQTRPGDWAGAIDSMKAELEQLVARGRTGSAFSTP